MPDPSRIDASTWLGVGVLGLLVFVIGVAIPSLPATAGLPDRGIVAIVVAIVGGIIAALGLGWAYDFRRGAPRPARAPKPGSDGPRDTSVRAVPSFQIYDPNAPNAPDAPKGPNS
jgi:hypothetical protein